MRTGSTDNFNRELDRISRDAKGCRARYRITGAIEDREITYVLYGPEKNTDVPEDFGKRPEDLRADMQDFLSEKASLRKWEPNTTKQVKVALLLVFEFRPGCTYRQIDAPFLNDFCKYMEETKSYAGATIQKRLSYLKFFLKWAEAKGREVQKETFQFQFRSLQDEKAVIFLTPEELAKVYRTSIPEVGQEAVYVGPTGSKRRMKVEYERSRNSLLLIKDLFLFCCFIGMRYSDMQNLKKSNVNRRKSVISYVSLKGKKRVNLDTNRYMMEILDRHRDNPTIFALPRLSMQKFNSHIGELMKICNIYSPVYYIRYRAGKRESGQAPKYELVTSHTGRKTFVCTSIVAGISLDVIIQWTGHAGPKEIRPYVAVAESMKRRYMDSFGEGLVK